jgi:hypothetical protein
LQENANRLGLTDNKDPCVLRGAMSNTKRLPDIVCKPFIIEVFLLQTRYRFSASPNVHSFILLTMFEQYEQVVKQYPKLPLHDERKLIRLAKRGNCSAQQTLLLHQVGFFIFRIRTTLYPSVVREHGEDILQECLLWTPNKIRSYSLRYRNVKGVFQPVQLRSYIWKGITGVIFQYVRKYRKEGERADL